MVTFVASVPMYVYAPEVLALLALHGGTAYFSWKRIRALQGALEMRDILLDGSMPIAAVVGQVYPMAGGDTLTIGKYNPKLPVVIMSSKATTLTVTQ